MIKKSSLILILFLVVLQVNSQEFIESVESKLLTATSNQAKEKVYLQTDKVKYLIGEDIWFKAYIVNSFSNTPSDLSKTLTVLLVDKNAKIIKKGVFEIKDGFAKGDFSIPNNLQQGVYKIVAYSGHLKNYNPDVAFSKIIEISYNIYLPVNLSYLLNDSIFSTNDTVKVSLNAKDNRNRNISELKMTWIVKLQNEIIYKGKLKSNKKGEANFSFVIDKDVKDKNMVVEVGSEIFSKDELLQILIPTTKQYIDLQFFPEGGDLVPGIEQQVAYKAVDYSGNPINIEGELIDFDNNVVLNFKSFYKGMGKFKFKADASKKYSVRLTKPYNTTKEFNFNIVKQKVAIEVLKQTKDFLSFKLSTVKKQELTVVLQTQGKIFWSSKGSLDKSLVIKIDTKDFPMGINRITVFNNEKLPVVERLVFLNHHKKLNIKIEANKDTVEAKGKVDLLISVKDEKGQPSSANLSLTVTDKLRQITNRPQVGIMPYLTLNTELKGKIPTPNFYFSNNKNSKEALDLLMLTHGWRKFSWKEVFNNKQIINEKLYNPEDLTGRVLNFRDKPEAFAKVTLLNTKTLQMLESKTDKNGRFRFPAKDYFNIASSDLTITAVSSKNSKRVKVVIDKSFDNRISNFNIYNLDVVQVKEEQINNKNSKELKLDFPIRKKNDKTNITQGYHFIDNIDVNAKNDYVTITEKEKANPFQTTEMKGKDLQQISSGLGRGFLDILAQVTTWQRVIDSYKVIFRGHNSILYNTGALFVLDGVPMGDNYHGLDHLDPQAIENIKVTKSINAAQKYGGGFFGLIEVTTKDSFKQENSTKNNTKQKNVLTEQKTNISIVKAYKIERKFYSPNYTEEKTDKLDIRSTLYWNPEIIVDESGKAKISFYNGDVPTKVLGLIEGINYIGKIGTAKVEFISK